MLRCLRSPRSSFASQVLYLRRVDGGPSPSCVPAGAFTGPSVPPASSSKPSFCKRCVPVASCSVVLRRAAYLPQTTLKSVLKGAFQKTKRAARTDKFLRMSERLAAPPETVPVFVKRPVFQRQLREVASMSGQREWRSLSEAVASVLRDVRTVPLTADAPAPAAPAKRT